MIVLKVPKGNQEVIQQLNQLDTLLRDINVPVAVSVGRYFIDDDNMEDVVYEFITSREVGVEVTDFISERVNLKRIMMTVPAMLGHNTAFSDTNGAVDDFAKQLVVSCPVDLFEQKPEYIDIVNKRVTLRLFVYGIQKVQQLEEGERLYVVYVDSDSDLLKKLLY